MGRKRELVAGMDEEAVGRKEELAASCTASSSWGGALEQLSIYRVRLVPGGRSEHAPCATREEESVASCTTSSSAVAPSSILASRHQSVPSEGS
jgi:hypothetical protein